MRRLISWLLVAGVLACAVAGCDMLGKKAAEPTPKATTAVPAK